ncbi:MAG: RNA-binding cell elongation regulator Jag/EloR [Clostridia bacterium]
MKRTTESIGKTVEEAIRKGLEELKVARDDVVIDVIEEPKVGGILGMLSQKLAKVKLTVDKKVTEDVLLATSERIDKILNDIFKITGEDNIKHTCSGDEKQVIVKIELDEPKHLIGYRGKTIESIQSILNAMLQREDAEYSKVFVEINNYKKEKEEKLKAFANKMADNVSKYKKPIKLEPMSSYERMIVHQELSSRSDVMTESYGEEPNRRLVIKKKFNNSNYND